MVIRISVLLWAVVRAGVPCNLSGKSCNDGGGTGRLNSPSGKPQFRNAQNPGRNTLYLSNAMQYGACRQRIRSDHQGVQAWRVVTGQTKKECNAREGDLVTGAHSFSRQTTSHVYVGIPGGYISTPGRPAMFVAVHTLILQFACSPGRRSDLDGWLYFGLLVQHSSENSDSPNSD